MRLAWMMAVLVTLPAPAAAWRRAETDTGLVLEQPHDCIYWTLARSGTPDVADVETLHSNVARGFGVWNEPACGSVSFIDAGPSSCTSPHVADRGTQATLVVWLEDEWPYSSPLGNPFAATGLWYDPDTGDILDADISLNGVGYTWGVDGDPEEVDVWSIIAHESGHVLGLGESEDPSATMYGYALVGETNKRDLADDDVEALCTLFPADASTRPCPSPPGSAALCGQSGGCGCLVASRRPPGGGAHPTPLVLAALALITLANRRKRR
jgi:hypothetical protein